MVWHIIRAHISLIVNVILTDGIRMFTNTLTKKIEANCKITIFFSSGIINLIARIFRRPCGARKNTTLLAKYPHVLYAKPSTKVYVSSLRALVLPGRKLRYEKRERNSCQRPSLIEPAGKTCLKAGHGSRARVENECQ